MMLFDLFILALIVISGIYAFTSLENSKALARAKFDPSSLKRKYIDQLMLSRNM